MNREPRLVRCERDGCTFEPIVKDGYRDDPKLKTLVKARIIDCPHCGRRYIWNPETETWTSDRQLTILKGGE